MYETKIHRVVLFIFLFFIIVFLALLTQLPKPLHPRAPLDLPWHAEFWPENRSRDVALYVRPDVNTTLISAADVCAEPLLLLIVVCSAVKKTEERMAIRETWASPEYVGHSARVVFFLGTSGTFSVMKESRRYGDIVQEDFVDRYVNLTIKTVMILKWFKTYCPKIQNVMKTDDDMFVNIDALIRLVKSKPAGLMGKYHDGKIPLRDPSNKWYSPTYMFPDSVYPDYISGSGYVMTQDVAVKLYAAALVTPLFHLEDVFLTGICARRAGVRPVSARGFMTHNQEFAPCGRLTDLVITSHNINPTALRRRWCAMKGQCAEEDVPKLSLKHRFLRFMLCLVDKAGFDPIYYPRLSFNINYYGVKKDTE